MLRRGDTEALKFQGKRLGRAGLAERVIELVEEFQKAPTYIKAITLAGRLSAIVVACKFDDYWTEKAQDGWHREMHALHDIAAPQKIDPDSVRAESQH
jgi:hypothetical protein